MREQMPHGRAGRPGRLVQVDDALLGRDENGQGTHRLGDGSEPDRATRVSVGMHFAVAGDHSGRGERDRPALDLAEGLHAARY